MLPALHDLISIDTMARRATAIVLIVALGACDRGLARPASSEPRLGSGGDSAEGGSDGAPASVRRAEIPDEPASAAGAAIRDGGEHPRASSASWTEALRLQHASHPLPEGAPSVVVHAPRGFDPDLPLQLVIFLHGWRGCAPVLAGSGEVSCLPGERPQRGWGLAEVHDRAGTGSLFVVPQLAYRMRSGRPGRFREDGFFRGFLEELLGDALASRLGGPKSVSDVESVTLVPHSAGYETALMIVRRGGVDGLLRHVVLMDALYAGPLLFAAWAGEADVEPPRRIVSLYTGLGSSSRVGRRSLTMADSLEHLIGASQVAVDPPGDLGEAIRTHRAVVARSRHPHEDVPARHLAEVLPALGLRRRAVPVAAE